jgi:hypothetical protein
VRVAAEFEGARSAPRRPRQSRRIALLADHDGGRRLQRHTPPAVMPVQHILPCRRAARRRISARRSSESYCPAVAARALSVRRTASFSVRTCGARVKTDIRSNRRQPPVHRRVWRIHTRVRGTDSVHLIAVREINASMVRMSDHWKEGPKAPPGKELIVDAAFAPPDSPGRRSPLDQLTRQPSNCSTPFAGEPSVDGLTVAHA